MQTLFTLPINERFDGQVALFSGSIDQSVPFKNISINIFLLNTYWRFNRYSI